MASLREQGRLLDPTASSWTWTRWEREGDWWEARSPYVDRFWLPRVGPSVVALMRYASRVIVDAYSEQVEVAEVVRALGFGDGRHQGMRRTIQRAIDFGLARIEGPTTIGFATGFPTLSTKALRRFPETEQQDHQLLVVQVELTTGGQR